MMSTDIELTIAPIEAIPPGEGRTFEVAGERLAVFRTRTGEVFATQAECPHKGGPLADGLVGGTTLICPLHTWKFDLQTGEALLGSCGVKTYPVRLDSEKRVLVTLTVSQAASPIS
jgi:nitrite reductase (NADH) small subunit